MAGGAVWGIDIGQCALKALRCRADESQKKIIAEAFDYIEYPKILSQPGSDPAELVADALKQFLSRNSVLGDRVAISVSGQAGLARFIKLPPVESKKIPDIVRYEARQQIPFDLNDVIWDYQRMGGGAVEEGFALETEVGLFAMKREAVFRALDPFLKLDIEVDIVQLTPLVLYNFVVFDQMGDLPPPEEFDLDNPPESVVVISMGADATDLVITNGFRVWQRSIPLGGSHFTKALTRELKLTFAKAEHLKRNATAAADPKAVFQAMKPTFADLLTELQRSIGYFSNLDRAAKIGRVVALGNAMKLPGLRRYLSQSLGYDIEKLDSYRELVGPQVVTAPAFQENLLSFPVCYGLAIQGLGKGSVHTNLLPREILQDRLVKRKKPWAVAAAAMLLLGCAISYMAHSLAMGAVAVDSWKQSQDKAKQLISRAGQLRTEDSQVRDEFQKTNETGKRLVGNFEGRVRWLELFKAINACLPVESVDVIPAPGGNGKDAKPKDPKVKEKKLTSADRVMLRRDLHVTSFDCQQVDDVAQWYSNVKKFDDSASDAPGSSPSSPQGPGYIVRLIGYHYHNGERTNQGAQYVRKTLIEKFRNGEVQLPAVDGSGKEEKVKLKDLGISCPVVISRQQPKEKEITDPFADLVSGAAAPAESHTSGGGGFGSSTSPASGGPPPAAPPGSPPPGPTDARKIVVLEYDFTVEFCWQPKTPAERLEAKKALKDKTGAPAPSP